MITNSRQDYINTIIYTIEMLIKHGLDFNTAFELTSKNGADSNLFPDEIQHIKTYFGFYKIG